MLEDKEHWRFLSEWSARRTSIICTAPEFTVCHYSDDERDGYEYYMLNQTDPSPSWYTIEIRYFQTRIFDTLGIALDSGRYFAPVPSRRVPSCVGIGAAWISILCIATTQGILWIGA